VVENLREEARGREGRSLSTLLYRVAGCLEARNRVEDGR